MITTNGRHTIKPHSSIMKLKVSKKYFIFGLVYFMLIFNQNKQLNLNCFLIFQNHSEFTRFILDVRGKYVTLYKAL